MCILEHMPSHKGVRHSIVLLCRCIHKNAKNPGVKVLLMCRQILEEEMRIQQVAVGDNTVQTFGKLFPILQREKEIHELVHHMGDMRAWSKDIQAAATAE